jgi:hypothetical protein
MKVGFFFEINGMLEIQFQPAIHARRRTKVPVLKDGVIVQREDRRVRSRAPNRSNSFGHRCDALQALHGIPDQQWKETASLVAGNAFFVTGGT